MVNALEANLSQTQMEVFIWVTMGISLTLTIARSFVRLTQYRRFYSDDYWAVLGTILLLATAFICHWMIPGIYESQRMVEQLPTKLPMAQALQKVVLYLKLQVAIMNTFWGSLWAVKISFLMLIRRLLLSHNNQYRWWWWIVTGYVVLCFIGEIIINLVACIPLPRRWSLDPAETCGNEDSGLILQGVAVALDMSSDLAIMILPMKILAGLMLARTKRFGVQAMFGLSLIVVVVSAVRCALTTSTGAAKFDQIRWLAWTWSEAWVATAIVNIPVFKKHLDIIWERASSIKSTFLSKSSFRSTNGDLSRDRDVRLESMKLQGKRAGAMDSETGLVSQVVPEQGVYNDREGKGIRVDSHVMVTSGTRGARK